MKATLRIPTVQYGYIEFEIEQLTPREIIKLHNEITELYKQSQVPKVEKDMRAKEIRDPANHI